MALGAARRLPIVQQRTFMPDTMVGRKIIEENYPEQPNLTDAEDPEMVRMLGEQC